jgi:hypothetical protein
MWGGLEREEDVLPAERLYPHPQTRMFRAGSPNFTKDYGSRESSGAQSDCSLQAVWLALSKVLPTSPGNWLAAYASARKSNHGGLQKRGTERDASYCAAGMPCPCNTAVGVSSVNFGGAIRMIVVYPAINPRMLI